MPALDTSNTSTSPDRSRRPPTQPTRSMQPTLHVPAVTITDTLDTLHHPLRDLWISVTDRCNFRCVYCMPKAIVGRDFQFLPPAMLLSFEEITRLACLFIASGVGKIWLMDGESLVRREVEWLVAMLAELDGLRVQSIAEEDVSRRSADPALAPPTRQIQEIGGPQVLSLGKMCVRGSRYVRCAMRSCHTGYQARWRQDITEETIRVVSGILMARSRGHSGFREPIKRRFLHRHPLKRAVFRRTKKEGMDPPSENERRTREEREKNDRDDCLLVPGRS